MTITKYKDLLDDQIDFELERMVNPITAARRKEREVALRTIPVAKRKIDTRVENLKLFCAVAGRFGIGLVFLGAITRAWIVPGFGVAAAVACFVWAYGRFLRRRR